MTILTRRGSLVSQLTSPMTKNVDLRLAQYERYKEPAFLIRTAISIVTGKIRNSLKYLRRFSYNHPGVDIKREIETLQGTLDQIGTQQSLQRILGVEGHAAKVYYNAFSNFLRYPR